MLRFRRGFIRSVLLLAVFLNVAPATPNVAAIHQEPASKQSDKPDPFNPLRMFIGRWEGDSKGEPGVGKTAVAEGLAQRIVNQDVPPTLHDKRIVVFAELIF